VHKKLITTASTALYQLRPWLASAPTFSGGNLSFPPCPFLFFLFFTFIAFLLFYPEFSCGVYGLLYELSQHS